MNLLSTPLWARLTRAARRQTSVLGLFLAVASAQGASHTWSGAGSTALWSNAANWSAGGAPVAGESNVVLIFPSTASKFTSTPNVANLSVDRMEFQAPTDTLVSWTVTNGGTPITVSGAAGDNIRLPSSGTTVTWQPALTLQNTCRFNTAGGAAILDLQGVVAGSGGLVKLGIGLVKFSTGSAANTFTGLLSVQGGNVRLEKTAGTPCFGGNLEIAGGGVAIGQSHQIPDAASITISAGSLSTSPAPGVASVTETLGPITINTTVWANNIWATSPNTLVLSGNVTLGAGSSTVGRLWADAPSGQISLGGATRTLTVPTAGGRLEITGNVVDGGAAAGIVKQGDGELIILDPTSFSGPLTVAAGSVRASDPQALGSTAGATIVQAGASLVLATDGQSATLPAAETIQLAGTLNTESNVTVPGSVILSGSPTLTARLQRTLTLSGVLSGSPTTTTILGPGTTVFSGTAANTFTGTLNAAGLLNLGKTAGLNAVPPSLRINVGTIKLLASNQIPDSASIVWDANGTLDLNSQNETLTRLDGARAGVRLFLGDGALTLTDSADAVLGLDTVSDRVEVWGSPQSRLRKLGAGTLTLNHDDGTGVNGYPTLSVESGTVQLANQWLGRIELKGGVLRGQAITGPLVGLGGSVCLCDFEAASFSGPATILASINGDTPGTGYDQLTVKGAIDLTGQTLQLSLGAFTPMTSGTFKIIDNNGGAAITGTFAGLPEGATVTVNGQPFRISYHGGSGQRDVVLRYEGIGTPGPVITSIRPIAGGFVEVKGHWLPGKNVTLERADLSLTSWGPQVSGVFDANGDVTLTFQNFGSRTQEFVRLSVR